MKIRQPIPIVILHRNDGHNLKIMVHSIKERTRYPYDLFIVDNNSTDVFSSEVIETLSKDGEISVIRSKKNNWVLGFNSVFQHNKWKIDYQYFIFSDCDIEVPFLEKANLCWLEHLVEQMDQNRCIGKLGISLSTEDIDKGEIFEKVIEEEKRFDTYPTIGSNRINPVDTTLAIYRPDFFVYKQFRFKVGHASLARPYYFTCRTSRVVQARHLGWYNRGVTNHTKELLPEKIKCFARYGAYIEPAVLKQVSTRLKFHYKIVHIFARVYWGTSVFLYLLRYYLSSFPRNVNKVQNHCR